MRFVYLEVIGFEEALRIQETTVQQVAEGTSAETVYLLEHPHVFTCGRGGSEANLLRTSDWEGNPINLCRTNRGGDVTYHGPGQLVGYPHLDLRRRDGDVHRYLRELEECLIGTVAEFGVAAFRREGLTGAWTEKGKLASIGIGVRRWVTMHGFALNVSTDLRYFGLINPCGMVACPVVSLSSLLGQPVEMRAVKEIFTHHFKARFGQQAS
jgi:lipoyl(octanoyl) transferase